VGRIETSTKPDAADLGKRNELRTTKSAGGFGAPINRGGGLGHQGRTAEWHTYAILAQVRPRVP